MKFSSMLNDLVQNSIRKPKPNQIQPHVSLLFWYNGKTATIKIYIYTFYKEIVIFGSYIFCVLILITWTARWVENYI